MEVITKELIVEVVKVTDYEAPHQNLNPSGDTRACSQFKVEDYFLSLNYLKKSNNQMHLNFTAR
jgi:hypothetical protein